MTELSKTCTCGQRLRAAYQKKGSADAAYIVFCFDCKNGPKGKGDTLEEAVRDFHDKLTPSTPTTLNLL